MARVYIPLVCPCGKPGVLLFKKIRTVQQRAYRLGGKGGVQTN